MGKVSARGLVCKPGFDFARQRGALAWRSLWRYLARCHTNDPQEVILSQIDRIEKRWWNDPALQALSVEDAKAVIDALAIAMYADFEREADEETAFERAMDSLPGNWNDIEELSNYANGAADRAAALRDSNAIVEQIQKVAAKLPAAVHRQTFGMIITVMVSDRELEGAEGEAISAFARAIGLDENQAREVYTETLDALGLTIED